MGDYWFQYRTWKAKNPEVYSLFEKFALEAAGKGRCFGVKLIAERVRWEVTMTWDTTYKINNNYTAYIARDLIHRFPHLGRCIQLRKVKNGA